MRKPLHFSHYLLPVLSAAALALAACGPGKPEPTPTLGVEAIYTAAFHTLTAQRATELALTPPTGTPTETPSPTLLASPTPGSLPPAGGSTAPAGGGAAQACDSSVFVADVTIPDGTVEAPGRNFTKTWTVMNNGTCDWTTSYKLALVGGDAMSGTSTPIPGSVPAGQQVQLSVDLTAPTAPGNYTGSWQLENAAGQPFGNIITVVIQVGSGAGSATETPAAAATGTP